MMTFGHRLRLVRDFLTVSRAEALILALAALTAAALLLRPSPAPGVTAETGSSAARPEYLASSGLIDLNSAGVEALELLPGIGPVRAADIAAYREEYGGFRSVWELYAIESIPVSVLYGIIDYVCVEDSYEDTGS